MELLEERAEGARERERAADQLLDRDEQLESARAAREGLRAQPPRTRRADGLKRHADALAGEKATLAGEKRARRETRLSLSLFRSLSRGGGSSRARALSSLLRREAEAR